jgi:hypothetical protein
MKVDRRAHWLEWTVIVLVALLLAALLFGTLKDASDRAHAVSSGHVTTLPLSQ